jgi:hypothetical protein
MGSLSEHLNSMSYNELKDLLPSTKNKPKVRAYIKKLMKKKHDGFDFTDDDFKHDEDFKKKDDEGFEFDMSDFNRTESLNLLDDDSEEERVFNLERDNLNNNLQNRMNSEIDINKYYKINKNTKGGAIIPPYSANDESDCMYAPFEKKD